ncbi:hypothetical protein ACRUZW_26035 [Mycobacterium colombiense]
MTDDAMVFVAEFDGQESQTFLTLQNAMFWVEDLDRPTGTISFEGEPIVRYTNGDVDLAR